MARTLGVEAHLGEMTIRWLANSKIDKRETVSVVTYVGSCPELPDLHIEIDVMKSDEWDPGTHEWFIFGRISKVYYLPNAIIVHFEHPDGRGCITMDGIDPVRE